jgi:hypothetical protein
MKVNNITNDIILQMKHGSHLYGTNTPLSDLDIKGIFLPTIEQIFLNNIPKHITKNSKKIIYKKIHLMILIFNYIHYIILYKKHVKVKQLLLICYMLIMKI